MTRRTSRRRSSRNLRTNRSTGPVAGPAFSRWFGDSKVVDAQGEPLVVWHGHRKNVDVFHEFDPERVVDIGFHFGTKRAAEEFGTVRPFYLSLQNPLRLDDPGDWLSGTFSRYGGVPVLDLLAWAGVIDEPEYETAYNKIQVLKRESLDNNFHNGSRGWTLLRAAQSAIIARLLEKHGYDGIVYKNETESKGSTSWIALRPEQIKSADDNIGTYDPQSPDIRKNGR